MANIYGTPNDDTGSTLAGTATADKIYGYGGSDDLYGGGGNDVLYGGEGSDSLYGGEGNDQLSGGEGADYMAGGIGNDTYYVDDIEDVVYEASGEGTDTVVSQLSGYTLRSNIEVLRIDENAATDANGRSNGNGNELDNTIQGSNIANQLNGKAGNDSIYGYGGDDIIIGGEGNDILNGGAGSDTASYKDAGAGVTVSLAIAGNQNTGGAGIDKLTDFENLEGSEFGDTLTGNASDNKINGLGGGDSIRGGGGNDDLTGGTGADTFRFEAAGAANGVDTIRAFSSADDTLIFATADGYDAGAIFTSNASGSASGGTAQFVYNTTTQQLSYDADGDGAGAAVLLANFSNNPATVIQASDIAIV